MHHIIVIMDALSVVWKLRAQETMFISNITIWQFSLHLNHHSLLRQHRCLHRGKETRIDMQQYWRITWPHNHVSQTTRILFFNYTKLNLVMKFPCEICLSMKHSINVSPSILFTDGIVKEAIHHCRQSLIVVVQRIIKRQAHWPLHPQKRMMVHASVASFLIVPWKKAKNMRQLLHSA